MTFLYLIWILVIQALAQEPTKTELEILITEFAEPIQEWVGFNRSALEVAKECKMDELEADLLNFHLELAETGEDFTRQHLDLIKKVFK